MKWNNGIVQLLLIGFVFYCFSASLSAQEPEQIDSLIVAVKTAPEDINKLEMLLTISNYGPDGVWQAHNEKMGELSQKLMRSDTSMNKAATKRYYAQYLNNKAFDYTEKAKYVLALDCYDKCIKISKEIKDYDGLSLALSSVGAIYQRLGENDKALEYYTRALVIEEKFNHTNNMVATYNNIGVVYRAKKENAKALVVFRKAEKLIVDKRLSNQITPTVYVNLGDAMLDMGNEPAAMQYYQASLSEANKIGDNKGKASSLTSIAELYLKQGNSAKASDMAKQALDIATSSNSPYSIKKSSSLLKDIYQKQGDYKKAFEMYHLLNTSMDSLKSIDNQKAIIRFQFQTDYELKQAKLEGEQDKKNALAREEIEQQKKIRNYVIGGLVIVLLFLSIVVIQRNNIKKEKNKSEELLLNILPSEVAEELKAKGSTDAKQFDKVTVMFTDFKGFTQISERLTPGELVAEIDACFKAFDNIIGKHNIEKIKTIGDAYMCAGGLPLSNSTHAEDVVKAALEIRHFMQQHLQERKMEGKEVFEIRIGIHTGPVVAGIVGVKKFAYDIWGDTVNIASRMESSGETGKINISGSTFELIKDKFHCVYRGKVQAKNKGEIDMYFVETSS